MSTSVPEPRVASKACLEPIVPGEHSRAHPGLSNLILVILRVWFWLNFNLGDNLGQSQSRSEFVWFQELVKMPAKPAAVGWYFFSLWLGFRDF